MVIMYFENLSDPEDEGKYGQMITSLVSTDLGESEYMRVVNRQRIYDILKQMGRGKQKVVDKEIASEVAKKAHVNWVVTGNVIQTEPNIVVTSEISHAVTGEVRASQRVRGEPGKNILDVADKLSAEIRKDFALPKAAKQELDRAVADITTSSPDAYRHYVEGVQHWFDFEFEEASESFNAAIALDSTFAMAYLELARTVWLQGAMDYTTMSARELCEKAVEYSDGVSWREKREIEGMHGVLFNDFEKALTAYGAIVERDPDDKAAWHRLGEIHRLFTGDLAEALTCYDHQLALDSLDTSAYHGIAYTSAMFGDRDRALWAANRLVELDPDLPDPHDTRGDILLERGEVDQALASFNEAEKRRKHYSIFKIAIINLFRGNYAETDSIVRECITGGEWSPKSGRRVLAYIPMCQGRFEYALVFLDNAIAADRMETRVEEYDKHALKGIIHAEKGEVDKAIEELNKANELKAATGGPPWNFDSYKVCFLADAGRIEEAREITESIRAGMTAKAPRTKMRPDHMPEYWRALGIVEMATGEADSAVAHLRKAVSQKIYFKFSDRFCLGRAYLEAGMLEDAIRELTVCTASFGLDAAYVSPWWVRSHYLLGKAYEAAGQKDEAAQRYEEFFDIWKDADPDLPVLADARERLAGLQED
jgi:tetratricopeptide (TPR) repeat protein